MNRRRHAWNQPTCPPDWHGIILAILALLACYSGVAMCRFAYAHPWMTDTQRSLHFGDALMWKTIKEPSK